MRAQGALIAAILAAACSPEDPDQPPACDVPEVVLDVAVGTGLDEFQEMADGASTLLVYGPQGGFHIWTAIRVRGASVERVTVELEAVREDGTRVGGGGPIEVTMVASDDARVRAGLYTYVDVPEDAEGQRVTITATVTACGHGRGTAQVVVVPERA